MRLGGLVHQVDRLVGQEAVGDVAVGERRRGDERAVGDPHAVVQLVFLLEPAQDRDRVLDRRLADEHRLEAPLQRGVLLDILAIFVERGRADAVQLAARQRGLEQVARRPSRLRPCPAPISVCISSMNRMMSPSAPLTSSSTPFSRSSNSPRYLAPAIRLPMSSAISRRSLRLSGTSPLAMRSARPSAIAVLPTPGSPISTGLFLVRRARIWIGAADLLVAADHRIELAVARRLR